jgi:ABC-type multidrug transport system ATPase subunit
VLRVTALSKRLGRAQVLESASLGLADGDVGTVLGENGTGKSTLLRLICGLLEPDRGEISICGASMRDDDVKAKSHLGYAPDATEALPDLLVGEFVNLVRSLKRARGGGVVPVPEEWLDRLRLKTFWHQSIGSLSFGQRKRMCIVTALCADPWLLVLDEPSNGLDPEGTDVVLALVESRQKSGQGTLLSTNDSAFAARVGGTQYRLSGGGLTRMG